MSCLYSSATIHVTLRNTVNAPRSSRLAEVSNELRANVNSEAHLAVKIRLWSVIFSVRDSSFTRHYIFIPLPACLGPSLLPSCPNKVSKFHVCASSSLCEMFIRPSLGVCVCLCVCVHVCVFVCVCVEGVHKWASVSLRFCMQISTFQQAVYGNLLCFDNLDSSQTHTHKKRQITKVKV